MASLWEGPKPHTCPPPLPLPFPRHMPCSPPVLRAPTEPRRQSSDKSRQQEWRSDPKGLRWSDHQRGADAPPSETGQTEDGHKAGVARDKMHAEWFSVGRRSGTQGAGGTPHVHIPGAPWPLCKQRVLQVSCVVVCCTCFIPYPAPRKARTRNTFVTHKIKIGPLHLCAPFGGGGGVIARGQPNVPNITEGTAARAPPQT